MKSLQIEIPTFSFAVTTPPANNGVDVEDSSAPCEVFIKIQWIYFNNILKQLEKTFQSYLNNI